MFYPHTIKGKVNLRLDIISGLPVNTSPPVISGDTVPENLLTVTPGSWVGTGTIILTYQWLRDGLEISGETATTYTTVLADDGTAISCLEYATDDVGTAQKLSNELNIGGVIDGNLARIDGNIQYFDAGNFIDYGNSVSFFMTARFKVHSLPLTISDIISNEDSDNDHTWRLYFTDEGEVQILVNSRGNSSSILGSAALSLNTWYTVTAGLNRTTLKTYLSIDAEPIRESGIVSIFNNSGHKTLVGSSHDGAQGHLDASISFAGIGFGTLTSAEISELSTVDAKCWGTLSTGLKAKFSNGGAFWELANWPGHTSQELVDQTGNGVTLSNIGNAPFTGDGLNIEC